jgi:hypothetical protein
MELVFAVCLALQNVCYRHTSLTLAARFHNRSCLNRFGIAMGDSAIARILDLLSLLEKIESTSNT